MKRLHPLLFGLIFAFAILPPLASAQPVVSPTNLSADTAPAPAITNAPGPAPAAPQLNPPNTPDHPAVQPEDIYDIRPPFFFLHPWFWLWIALGVIGAVALLVLLWNWFKPQNMLNPKTAYELALEKLEKARALLREDNPVPYAVFVSETIRTYLGQRFQAPSTRRTTEEFLRQMEADQATPLAEHRELLRDFLQSCDMVKFARYQPTLTELERVQQRAVTFVEATKPVPVSNQRNGHQRPS